MKTNWDAYYSKPAPTAALTRKISAHKLHTLFSTYAPQGETFFEFGGANSCFYAGINEKFQPRKYTILDNNPTGLAAFKKNYPNATHVDLVAADVLQFQPTEVKADIVFSVGLIEHFSPAETAKAIAAHFAVAKPDGIVVITFPHPTWLYSAARKGIEALGKWDFPDERPLDFSEVERTVLQYGKILDRSINWPIILTQGIIVARPLN